MLTQNRTDRKPPRDPQQCIQFGVRIFTDHFRGLFFRFIGLVLFFQIPPWWHILGWTGREQGGSLAQCVRSAEFFTLKTFPQKAFGTESLLIGIFFLL